MAWHQCKHSVQEAHLREPWLPPVQAENEALQALVVDVAANKAEARKRVAALKEKYSELLAKVGEAVPSGADAGHFACSRTLSFCQHNQKGVSAIHTCML